MNTMKLFNKIKGKKGENAAADYLKTLKYKIVETNYHSIYGEIDIIAKINSEIVFVEVKYRTTGYFGDGLEAVGKKKQDKIIKTALIYMNEYNIQSPCRFDVISIDGGVIKHIENAFTI